MRRLVTAAAAAIAMLYTAGTVSAAPIVVTPTNNGDVLAATLLAGVSGITGVTAVYAENGSNMSGTFTGGTGVLGFDSGIVLTTGLATNIIGPNNSGSASGGGTSSSLTLSFTPNGDNISFAYHFGSEEYNEFTGSSFNDNFSFFVNGVNYALIPGTNTMVSINNMNCVSNSSFYTSNSNSSTPNGVTCGNAGLDTQLDGLTTLLTFVAPVNVGVTNTLQMIINDVGDSIYDSAVMIQGGTLQVCGTPGQPACPGPGPGPGQVPEPTGLVLFGTGFAAAALVRRFRR